MGKCDYWLRLDGDETGKTHPLILQRASPVLSRIPSQPGLSLRGVKLTLTNPGPQGYSQSAPAHSLRLYPVVKQISCTTDDFQCSLTSYRIFQQAPGGLAVEPMSQWLSYAVKCGAGQAPLPPADHRVPSSATGSASLQRNGIKLLASGF